MDGRVIALVTLYIHTRYLTVGPNVASIWDFSTWYFSILCRKMSYLMRIWTTLCPTLTSLIHTYNNPQEIIETDISMSSYWAIGIAIRGYPCCMSSFVYPYIDEISGYLVAMTFDSSLWSRTNLLYSFNRSRMIRVSSNVARLAPNGTNLGILKINFLFIRRAKMNRKLMIHSHIFVLFGAYLAKLDAEAYIHVLCLAALFN